MIDSELIHRAKKMVDDYRLAKSFSPTIYADSPADYVSIIHKLVLALEQAQEALKEKKSLQQLHPST